MSDIAIRVENLGKKYRIGTNQTRYQTLRESIINGVSTSLERLKGNQPKEDNIIWALKDINFEVKHGEVLGIIGRNGAGKSTLLKILSRITKPSTGRFELNGRVGSLLEVGTGFHPELTGRENIYLSGAILGMKRKEINRKFDEIVDFAEIEKFLDTPVKHYSSGMYMRLAFSVAAHLEPEILLVDEVLAVGDAEFQKKCLGKMGEVAGQGRTVLFVSHNMGAVKQICKKTILLDNGFITNVGDNDIVIAKYQKVIDYCQTQWINNYDEGSWANPYFSPKSFKIINEDNELVHDVLPANRKIGVLIEGEISILHQALTIGFAVHASSGEILFWSQHKDTKPDQWPNLQTGNNKLVGWIPPHFLNEGIYQIELIASLHFTEWILEPGRNSPSISLHVQGSLSDSPYLILPRPGFIAPILPFEKISY